MVRSLSLEKSIFYIFLYIYYISDVFLSLNDTIIPNHGYLTFDDIGFTDESALLCHTNRPVVNSTFYSGGDWLTPDGLSLSSKATLLVNRGLIALRAPMLVRLRQEFTKVPPLEGLHRCAIQDKELRFNEIFVGLYSTGGGKNSLITAMHTTHTCMLQCSPFPQTLFCPNSVHIIILERFNCVLFRKYNDSW